MTISEKWNDVNDRLPDKEGYYLTVFCGESGFYAISLFDGSNWRQLGNGLNDDDLGRVWRVTSLVTHWRDIPSVFKEIV